MQTRGLQVTAEEAELFPFDYRDLRLAEAMLNGARSSQALAEEAGMTRNAVQQRLLDPVRCAFISRQISRAIESRLGNVLGAVYTRVMRNGDPQAAKLLLAQFGKLLGPVDRSVHEHRHVHMDFKQFSDAQLRAYVTEKQRELGADRSNSPEADAPDVDSDRAGPGVHEGDGRGRSEGTGSAVRVRRSSPGEEDSDDNGTSEI